MTRYVAFLRGVSPTNAKMPDLKACFESVGFSNVRTLLSSGNIIFDTRMSKVSMIEVKAEQAMQAALGRSFLTFVRPAEHLQKLVESKPFAKFELPAQSKEVITFLSEPIPVGLTLPIVREDASILLVLESEALCAYIPGPKGPTFMGLLEKTFGKHITTRTLQTVRKCCSA